jgi:hypothetical protein
MFASHFHDALRNLTRNKVYLATRMVALAGGLLAGSTIYMMRYALDYGGWLPDEKGIFPDIAYRSGDSLLIATMILHVDVALWHCLAISAAIFLAGALILIGRAARSRPDARLSVVHYL